MWLYTVCKGRIYLISAGQGLTDWPNEHILFVYNCYMFTALFSGKGSRSCLGKGRALPFSIVSAPTVSAVDVISLTQRNPPATPLTYPTGKRGCVFTLCQRENMPKMYRDGSRMVSEWVRFDKIEHFT